MYKPSLFLLLIIGISSIDTSAEEILRLRYVEVSRESACDDACQRQRSTNAITQQTTLLRGDPECRRSWYTGDGAGKRFAVRAKEECIDNKARSVLGLPGNSGSAKAEYAEHFEREGSRREHQRDRAIQINEGWQNRQAIDRQTDAIKQADRDGRTAQRNHHQEMQRQTRSIEGMERKIDREFSPLTRYIRGH